jgi:hypothetical protein
MLSLIDLETQFPQARLQEVYAQLVVLLKSFDDFGILCIVAFLAEIDGCEPAVHQ